MKKIILLLLFFIANFGFAQDSIQIKKYSKQDLEKEIKLNTTWKYKVGNNPQYKNIDYNDIDWKESTTTFLKTGDKENQKDFWFRKQFAIDSTLINKPISLMVTSKADAAVYLDGKLLGTFGKTDFINTPNAEINHPVVFALNNTDSHVLSVFYKEASTEKASLFSTNGFKVSLVTPATYQEKTTINHYLWLAINAIGFIFITLGVIHFILFGFYRKFIANLFFGLFNFCSGLSILFGYTKILKQGVESLAFASMIDENSVIFSAIGSIALSGTVNFLFNKNKISFYITTVLISLSLLLVIFVSKDFLFLSSTFTSLVFLEAIIVVLIAAINKKPGAKIIALGLIFSFGFALILGFSAGIFMINADNLTITQVALTSTLIMLSLFSTPFAMSAYLASNFASVSKKLQLQLLQIEKLSEENIKQEQERKALLENKMNFLEEEVKERTKEKETQKQQIEQQQTELLLEKQKSEDLLLNILPKDIADELKENGESKVKQFKDVSILFSDFTNLDLVSKQLNSQELLDELNHCFKAFDNITTKHQIEKIKTISYSYMAVSGLPLENENHAKRMIDVALEMRNFIEEYQTERKQTNKPFFEIKIGINSGEVVAGIVGIKKFAYDIWGDAVNTAARMKGISENGKINVGHTTYTQTKDFFAFEYRGELEIKGKGLTKMYFVENKTI